MVMLRFLSARDRHCDFEKKKIVCVMQGDCAAI